MVHGNNQFIPIVKSDCAAGKSNALPVQGDTGSILPYGLSHQYHLAAEDYEYVEMVRDAVADKMIK